MKNWKILAIMAVFLMLVMSSFIPATTAVFQKSNKAKRYEPLLSITRGSWAIASLSARYVRVDDDTAKATLDFIREPRDVVRIKAGTEICFIVYGYFEDRRSKPHDTYYIEFGQESNERKIHVFRYFSFGLYMVTSKDWKFKKPGTYTVTISAVVKGPYGEASISRDVTIEVFSSVPIQQNLIQKTDEKPIPVTTNPVLPVPSTTKPAVITTNPIISKLFETISEQINSYNSNVETTPSTTPNPQPNPSPTPAEEVQAEPADVQNGLENEMPNSY